MTGVKGEHAEKTKLSFRKKLFRCIIAVLFVFTTWIIWQISAYNKSVIMARQAGFYWEHETPFSLIREDWRNAFDKHTWGSHDRILQIEDISDLDVYSDMLQRLQPNDLYFLGCDKLENVDALQTINNLKNLHLCNCTMLQNVDGLKNHTSLRRLLLYACSSLQNIDGLGRLTELEYLDLCGCTELRKVNRLKNITSLRHISLEDCHNIPAADLRELSAALPNTKIVFPDGTMNPPQE